MTDKKLFLNIQLFAESGTSDSGENGEFGMRNSEFGINEKEMQVQSAECKVMKKTE